MIPKIIHQVWIGDQTKRPKFMQEWKDNHPDWEYILWDDDRVDSEDWANKKHIQMYRESGRPHGATDVMRYEIIYRYGGIVIPADEQFVSTLDDLLDEPFTVYECEKIYPGRLMPLFGAEKGYPLLQLTIEELGKREMGEPWITSGNMFWTEMCEGSDIKILPAYTFLPYHHRGYEYKGGGKVYGRQHFGTTHNKYGTL